MKKVALIILLFLVVSPVKAAFPDKITGIYNSTYVQGVGGWGANLKYDSNDKSILCTNYYKSNPAEQTCTKITDSTKSAYWNTPMKAAVAYIIRDAGTPTSGVDYVYLSITISKYQLNKGFSNIGVNSEGKINCGGVSCPKDRMENADKVYSEVEDAIKNISISIGDVTYSETSDAFEVSIPITTAKSNDVSIAFGQNGTTLSAQEISKSNGIYKYKILKANMASSGAVKITATAYYKEFISENYDCGAGYQTVTITTTEEEVVAKDTDTKEINLYSYYTLDVNSTLDGVSNVDGLYLNDVLYGTYSMKINGLAPATSHYESDKYDYWNQNTKKGTTYELKNITATDGFAYIGYSIGNSFSGALQSTVYAENSVSGIVDDHTSIVLHFKTIRDFKIIKVNKRGDKLAGVTFTVYSDENSCNTNTNSVGSSTTNQFGEAVVTLAPGSYYIKETNVGSYYALDNTCRPITVYKDPTATQNEIQVENLTKCESAFVSDSSVANRISIYINQDYARTYNRLLDFTITDATEACSNYTPTYTQENSCLITKQNTKTDKPFNANNLSAYNDVIKRNGVNVGFCVTEFETENSLSMPTNPVKAGMLVIGSKDNGKVLTGVLKKTCYVYENITSDFQDKYYSDYVHSIVIDNKNLLISSNPIINMKYIQTESNGLKKFVGQASVDYYFNGISVYKISGRPNCSGSNECTFIGYGVLSEFQDGKLNKSNFNYAVSFASLNNFNTASSAKLFTSVSSECEYLVEPEIIKYDEPNGKVDLEFRSIDVNSPFGRDTNSNWCDEDNCSYNNKTVQENITNRNNSYNNTGAGVLYSNDSGTGSSKIVLTPDLIRQIREYNTTHPYDNYEISCDRNGENCENAFLKQFNIVKVSN